MMDIVLMRISMFCIWMDENDQLNDIYISFNCVTNMYLYFYVVSIEYRNENILAQSFRVVSIESFLTVS